MNGTLPTRVRNNTESVDSVESYTRVTFSEEAVAKAGMFSSIEGGGDGIDYGRCSHGYTKGLCPYGCDAEIGGVDIVVCPDCHMQNGCVCPKCFYCGKKEKKCTCTRCTRCRCNSDPRKSPSPKLRMQSLENTTISAEGLMRLYFGESIEYFKATFGDQVSFPI